MFIGLFIILLLAWVLGFGVMHVASLMIHILLLAALVSLVMHFVAPRGRSVT